MSRRTVLPRERLPRGPRVRDRWERMARANAPTGPRVKEWLVADAALAENPDLGGALRQEAERWASSLTRRRPGQIILEVLEAPLAMPYGFPRTLRATYIPDPDDRKC